MEIYIVGMGFGDRVSYSMYNVTAFISESAAQRYIEESRSQRSDNMGCEIRKLIVGDEEGANWGFKKVFVASQNRERDEKGFWKHLGGGANLDAPIVVQEATMFFSPDSPRITKSGGWWSGYWMPEAMAPTPEEARSILESWRDEEKAKRTTRQG